MKTKTTKAKMRPQGMLLTGLLLAVALGAAGCKLGEGVRVVVQEGLDLSRYDASEALEWSIPYDGQLIVLQSPVGRVAIRGKAGEPGYGYVAVRPTLDVRAVKKVRGLKLEELRVTVEQDAQEVRIVVEGPPEMGRRLELEGTSIRWRDRVGWVEFELVVPPGATLSIEQDVGDVAIERLKGGRLSAATDVGELRVVDSELEALTLRSDAGRVVVRDTTAGTLSVNTAVGGISLETSAFREARLTSDTGGIAVRGAQGGRLTLSTDIGRIALEDVHVERLSATTDMGSITLALSRLPRAPLKPFSATLSADVGGITVRLPRTAALSLSVEARTEFGRISVRGAEGPDVSVQKDVGWPGERVTLRLGEGLSRLKLRTSMGSIEIVLQRPDVSVSASAAHTHNAKGG